MNNLHVIVGLGVTGISCIRYFAKQKVPMAVLDTRQHPPQLAEFQQEYPHIPVSLGQWDDALLDQAARIILSPGIAPTHPSITRQIARGIPVIGDIEVFAQAVKAPVIAITGTNAKSTVTTLVGEMAQQAGVNVKVGGNLGKPALDLLDDSNNELYVLELSSFQLDTTTSLAPEVATILNITPDHLDRYGTFEKYCHSKQQIYQHCKIAVCNRDDSFTDCGHRYSQQKFQFTLAKPNQHEFGLIQENQDIFLAFEDQRLMSVQELPIHGRHYQANALAALAIGYGYGLPIETMLTTLRTFKGLPHRCQLVRKRKGIFWYNDSKGTNVGATLAAILGLGDEQSRRVILIAGGVGKSADFSPLISPIEKYVKSVVLIGEAAPILKATIGQASEVHMASSMAEAVALSDQLSQSGDSVLLSPACASFDMFNNYEHRGDVFSKIVNEL